MKYNSFNINMVYSICMCYKLQSICNDPILLICYIHGAYLLSLFFQKYYTLVSNQNTTKFNIKIYRDNLSGIDIYTTQRNNSRPNKKCSKTHVALPPTNPAIIPNPTYPTILFYNKVIRVIQLW